MYYRIYNFIDDETIYKARTPEEILIYLNIHSDTPMDECYIQYYNLSFKEWVNI